MRIIDGRSHANEIYKSIKSFVNTTISPYGKAFEHLENNVRPTLAFFLIGDREDSKIYVGIKKKTCKRLGFNYLEFNYPETVTFNELQNKIIYCNKNSDVHGILVQCPLPKHIDESAIMATIDPKKDVDGFHSDNTSYLLQNHLAKREPSKLPFIEQSKEEKLHFYPCTPLGIITLLAREEITVKGKRIAIVGCGRVGRPLSMMFIEWGAVPTLCNSNTNYLFDNNLEKIINTADIIVTCTGVYDVVNVDWIRDDAIVIDVGVQRINNRLTGELDREKLDKRPILGTPSPGGVGPMTVAMLMNNLTLSWFFCQKEKLLGNVNEDWSHGDGPFDIQNEFMERE